MSWMSSYNFPLISRLHKNISWSAFNGDLAWGREVRFAQSVVSALPFKSCVNLPYFHLFDGIINICFAYLKDWFEYVKEAP